MDYDLEKSILESRFVIFALSLLPLPVDLFLSNKSPQSNKNMLQIPGSLCFLPSKLSHIYFI